MTCKLTPAEQDAFDRLYALLGRAPTLDEIRALAALAQPERQPG